MPKLRLDLTIRLGDVLTALAILVAASGLYYQARSVAVAERDLTAKVIEVGELAKTLEKERLERIAGATEQSRFSGTLSDLHSATVRDLDIRYNDFIASLALSSLALSVIADPASRISATQRAEHVRSVRDLQTAVRDLVAVSTAHGERLRGLGATVGTTNPGMLRNALEKANSEFETALQGPAGRYRAARDRLAKAFTDRETKQ